MYGRLLNRGGEGGTGTDRLQSPILVIILENKNRKNGGVMMYKVLFFARHNPVPCVTGKASSYSATYVVVSQPTDSLYNPP